MQELFNKNIFIYIMLGLCGGGVLLKVVLDIVYSRLVRASDNMGTAKNKLTQAMKKKFETCYRLKIGVNNVDIFVDKYVYRHRFCGILLSTWENIGGQILMICLLMGSISAVLGLIYECGKQEILSTFSVGILTSGLLILLEGMMNLSGKKELIRLNMKDYLENFFKVRLEQELFHPELLEQYKKEFLMQEEVAQAMSSSDLVAATMTANLGLNKKKEKQYKGISVRATKRFDKKQRKEAIRMEKKQNKIKAIEAKKREKEEKESEKERVKEEKRLAIEKRRETIELKRLQARETEERIKKEARLEIERRRDAERAEIEQKKAALKEQEEHSRDEKRRQVEIKKALSLEKQVMKEEKQKQTVEHKTIAQERKESLRREFQERRAKEVPGEGKELNTESMEKNNVSAVELEVGPIIEKIDQTPKVQVKTIYNKKSKQADSSEEKLIEDILKEFLA